MVIVGTELEMMSLVIIKRQARGGAVDTHENTTNVNRHGHHNFEFAVVRTDCALAPITFIDLQLNFKSVCYTKYFD